MNDVLNWKLTVAIEHNNSSCRIIAHANTSIMRETSDFTSFFLPFWFVISIKYAAAAESHRLGGRIRI